MDGFDKLIFSILFVFIVFILLVIVVHECNGAESDSIYFTSASEHMEGT